MAAADSTVEGAACDLCGLTSVLFFLARPFLDEFEAIALPAEACLKARPAGEESREDRGEAAADGERDECRDWKPLRGPDDERLLRAALEEREVWGASRLDEMAVADADCEVFGISLGAVADDRVGGSGSRTDGAREDDREETDSAIVGQCWVVFAV
jgi:hypothetical protein